MAERAKKPEPELSAEPKPDVTLGEQEQQFLAQLLAHPQVASVLAAPQQKIVAAVIQQKVSGG